MNVTKSKPTKVVARQQQAKGPLVKTLKRKCGLGKISAKDVKKSSTGQVSMEQAICRRFRRWTSRNICTDHCVLRSAIQRVPLSFSGLKFPRRPGELYILFCCRICGSRRCLLVCPSCSGAASEEGVMQRRTTGRKLSIQSSSNNIPG